MKKYFLFGALSVLGLLLLTAGTTAYKSRLIARSSSTNPTCATATGDGDICAEDAIEANGALDVGGASTLTGAVTMSSTASVAGALTVTGAINGAVLKTDEVAISLAELIALRATNKTLVAAVADSIIVPVSVLFFLDYGSAVCTESADNLALNYGGAAGTVACTAFETTGSWLVAGADSYGFNTCDTTLVAATANIVNKAITLDNNGDGEFGDCTGSTVTAWITYYVIAI